MIKIQELNRYIKENKIKLVLFAETHGFLDEMEIQKEVLDNVKFDIILYELLEDKKLISKEDFEKFLLNLDKKDFSIISKYGDLKPTIILARDHNLPIVGCDLKNTGRINVDFRTKEFTEKDIKEEEELMKKREKKQYQTILKFLLEDKKIFASIGFYHLLPNSYLMKKLSKNKFIIIYPEFKSGEKFGERIEFDKEEVYHKIRNNKEYIEDDIKD
jgi:hypothetical protein